MPRRKSKGIPALAAAFAVIGAEALKVESRADHVLAIVKTSKISDEKAFSAAVRDAYKANGWNAKPGKPKSGAEPKNAVPATVKQYVSHVRAAFRAGIDVAKVKTFHALRKAVKTARAKAKPKVKPNPDVRLEGVRLANGGKLIGAPFHDLTLVYEQLNRQQQAQLADQVTKLVRQYTPAAVTARPELVLVPLKKAA